MAPNLRYFILSGPSLAGGSAQPVDVLDLGSDHRAVRASFPISHFDGRSNHQKQKRDGKWAPPHNFKQQLERAVVEKAPVSVRQVEEMLVNVSERCCADVRSVVQLAPQFSEELSHLRAERRSCNDSTRRAALSKQIQKAVRKDLRRLKSEKVRSKLEDFAKLSELHMVHRLPVVRARTQTKPPDTMNEFLASIFRSTSVMPAYDSNLLREVPAVSVLELQHALQRMARGRCSDKAGVALEMIITGGDIIQHCLANAYNLFLHSGDVHPDWLYTFFTMIPKGGNVADQLSF